MQLEHWKFKILLKPVWAEWITDICNLCDCIKFDEWLFRASVHWIFGNRFRGLCIFALFCHEMHFLDQLAHRCTLLCTFYNLQFIMKYQTSPSICIFTPHYHRYTVCSKVDFCTVLHSEMTTGVTGFHLLLKSFISKSVVNISPHAQWVKSVSA